MSLRTLSALGVPRTPLHVQSHTDIPTYVRRGANTSAGGGGGAGASASAGVGAEAGIGTGTGTGAGQGRVEVCIRTEQNTEFQNRGWE
jgi:hypothetical protein